MEANNQAEHPESGQGVEIVGNTPDIEYQACPPTCKNKSSSPCAASSSGTSPSIALLEKSNAVAVPSASASGSSNPVMTASALSDSTKHQSLVEEDQSHHPHVNPARPSSSPFQPNQSYSSSSLECVMGTPSPPEFKLSFNNGVSPLQHIYQTNTESNQYPAPPMIYPISEQLPFQNPSKGFPAQNNHPEAGFNGSSRVQVPNSDATFILPVTENANLSPNFAQLENANIVDMPQCYGNLPQASSSLSSATSGSNLAMFEFGQHITSPMMQHPDQGNIMLHTNYSESAFHLPNYPAHQQHHHPNWAAGNVNTIDNHNNNTEDQQYFIQQGTSSTTCCKKSDGPSSTMKPKRKRKISKDQRSAANQRERKRMVTLNQAFEELQERIPTFSYEKKLSRIETLKLAIGYIWFMQEVLNGSHPEHINLGYFIESLPLLGHKIDRLYSQIYS